jgi:general secretion pathway protein N
MIRRVTRFELATAASLVALAAAFWAVMEAVPIANEFTVPRSPSSDANAGPASIESFQMRPLDSFPAFLDRPLFSPSRRPAEIVLAVPETEPVTVAPAPSIELTGLIITAQDSVGIIRLPGAGGVRRVVVGDTVEGWLVEEIAPGRLLLRRGDQRTTVSAAKMGDASVEESGPLAKSPQ